MKKTEIAKIPFDLPGRVGKICSGARVFDSSCSADARVYFIDRNGGYYLKIAKSGRLEREALMTSYFYRKRLSAEVLDYISGENDILLTRALCGEDCTDKIYLSEPKRLCDLMGEKLRELHEVDFSDCPIQDRISEYIALAEANYRSGSYNKEHFPDSFGYSSGEEAFSALSKGKKLLKKEVLIHGDYCLPNIMLDDWRFSGFIDLDSAGVGDRHIDLFWGAWSLGFNLSLIGEGNIDVYKKRFFDSYGRDKINEEALIAVAAAEVFS